MLAVGWFFFILSFLNDLLVPNDIHWFARSGAILCVMSLSAEFRLNRSPFMKMQGEEHWQRLGQNESGQHFETRFSQRVTTFTHFSVAMGTLAWAYGDLPFS